MTEKFIDTLTREDKEIAGEIYNDFLNFYQSQVSRDSIDISLVIRYLCLRIAKLEKEMGIDK